MTKPTPTRDGRNLGVVGIHNGRGRAILVSEADPQGGAAVVHARRMDFLDDWRETSRITGEQWQVARDFQANWYRAGHRERYGSTFEMIAAPSRAGRGVDYDGLARGVDAQAYIRRALAPLGPDQRSVVVNVLGFEKSFRQCAAIWRQNGRATNVDRLTGILEAALETIVEVMLRGAGRRT